MCIPRAFPFLLLLTLPWAWAVAFLVLLSLPKKGQRFAAFSKNLAFDSFLFLLPFIQMSSKSSGSPWPRAFSVVFVLFLLFVGGGARWVFVVALPLIPALVALFVLVLRAGGLVLARAEKNSMLKALKSLRKKSIFGVRISELLVWRCLVVLYARIYLFLSLSYELEMLETVGFFTSTLFWKTNQELFENILYFTHL